MTRLLHLSHAKFGSFNDDAKWVFGLLGIVQTLEHDSVQHFGGVYYRGLLDGRQVTMTTEDDRGFEDCQYWLVLRGSKEPLQDAWMANIIKTLLNHGIRVFEDHEGEPGVDSQHVSRLKYGLSPTGLSSQSELVRVASAP